MLPILVVSGVASLIMLSVVIAHCIIWFMIYRLTGGRESFRRYVRYL